MWRGRVDGSFAFAAVAGSSLTSGKVPALIRVPTQRRFEGLWTWQGHPLVFFLPPDLFPVLPGPRFLPALLLLLLVVVVYATNRNPGGQHFSEGRVGRTEAPHIDRNGARRSPQDHLPRYGGFGNKTHRPTQSASPLEVDCSPGVVARRSQKPIHTFM